MTQKHKELHRSFILLFKDQTRWENGFIKLLQEAEATKLYRAYRCRSLARYAIDVIGFSEPVAFVHIYVARKATEFPELVSSGLSVSKASRIAATLTKENVHELIQFARTHTQVQIDREVARRNPKSGREKFKPTGENFYEGKFAGSDKMDEKLKRVQALQAQRGLDAGIGAAIEAGLDEYLRRWDPVQKAERAHARKQKKEKPVTELCLNKVGRKPLTAEQRNAVFLHDQGKCTHDEGGQRCGSDRWVEIHHILEVCNGGSNEPENLTTLCSFHHDLRHLH